MINYHNLNNAELANLLLADVGVNREMLVEAAKRLGTTRPRQHKKWEYKEVETNPNDSEEYQDMLKRLGLEGWELVSELVSGTDEDGSWYLCVTFKREILT